MAQRFNVERASHAVLRMGNDTSFAVTRLSCGEEGVGRTLPIPTEHAFVVVLQLRPQLRHELWS